jgi:nicotinamide mononucleotide transporter
LDVLYVGLFIYKGLYLTAGLYALFCLLAIHGWQQWRRAPAVATVG